MTRIVDFFIDPINLLSILLLIWVGLFLMKKSVWAQKIVFVFVVVYFITAFYLVPDLLVRNLESKFSPVDLSSIKSDSTHILVLGGGHIRDPKVPSIDQLSASSLSRLLEGIRIRLVLPGGKLICSGYGGVDSVSNASVMRNAALELGLDGSSIQMLEKAANTWEEAQYYRERFGTSVPLILVTSATHMKRAMMVFNAMGLNPIPAPTDFIVKKRIRRDWLSHENFRKVQIALHEYIGLVYYRWKLG